MGQQIIKQPDGGYAVFSTVVDTWVLADATAGEICDHFATQAAADARRGARHIIDQLESGVPRAAYAQFQMTFEQADEKSYQHTGKRMADYRAEWEAEQSEGEQNA